MEKKQLLKDNFVQHNIICGMKWLIGRAMLIKHFNSTRKAFEPFPNLLIKWLVNCISITDTSVGHLICTYLRSQNDGQDWKSINLLGATPCSEQAN